MYRIADVCFICKTQCSCIVVDDKIVREVKYLLPEIAINNSACPVYICSTCEKYLDSFCKFKQKNVQKNLRLEANDSDISIKENFSDHEFNDNDDTEDESATQRRGNHNFEDHINIEPTEENSISFESCTEKSKDNISIKEEFNDNIVYVTDKHESINDNNINCSEVNQETNEYECPICHEFFIKSEILITHMRSHTKILSDIQKAECPICNKIKSFHHLKIHFKSHFGIKDFHCSICKKSFIEKTKLLCHMQVHDRVKKIQCTEKSEDNISINEEFNDNIVQVIDKDESMNDNNINSSKCIQVTNEYECPICHEYFMDSENLITHIKKSHTTILTDIKKARCPICNKIQHVCNLKRHLKSHVGIKDFRCSICNELFSKKEGLKYHLKIHSGKKDVQCSICKKNFLTKMNLYKHMKIHSKKKDDTHCETYNDENEKHLSIEDKSLEENSNENLEEKITKDKSISETNVKSNSTDYGSNICFECPICHKLFAEKENIVRHIKNHTRIQCGKKSAQFPICSKFMSTTQERSDQKFKEIFISEEDFTSDSYFNDSKKHIEDQNASLGTSGLKLKENIKENLTDSQFHNIEIEKDISVKKEFIEENSSDLEFYDEILQDVVKDENIIDNNINCSEVSEEISNDLECNDNVEQQTKVSDSNINCTDNQVITKYECPSCHKLFIKSEHLIKHLNIKTHVNIELDKSQFVKKKSQCSLCNKFVVASTMKRHLKSHAGIKDFHCSVCNKLFMRKENLDRHLRTHIGRRDFQCEICNKTFVTKQSLMHHKQYHKRKLKNSHSSKEEKV